MASIPAGSQYVAMGSSFGAGPGLTPRAPGSPRRAGRSASNDVGYLPRLTLASLPGPLRALPQVRARVAGFGDPAATDERFAGLGRNLQAIARGVRDRAPACRVLFVDYLTILPLEDGHAGPPPPPGIADWGRTIAARLAAATRAAAEATGVEYVAAVAGLVLTTLETG